MTGAETLVSIRLPAVQAAQLREKAVLRGESLEAFVEQIVLREAEPPKPLPQLPPAPFPEDDYVDGGWDWVSPPFRDGPTIRVRFVDGGPLTPQPYREEE